MNQKKINRIIIYVLGMFILTIGLTLNTKAGLGVSPIISVAYIVSQILEINFGDITLIEYTLFIAVEIVIHLILHKKERIIADVLQLPISFAVTRLLNLFSWIIPDAASAFADRPMLNFTIRILVLLLAVAVTGVGAAMSVYMRIVPNPGDGIVQALADLFGKDVGFTKNCFDFCCIVITFLIGLFTGNFLLGIGIGTVIAMIGVGRVIALFHRLFWNKLIEVTDIK